MQQLLGFDQVRLGFDLLLFLGITNLKSEEKNIVSQRILDRISQYTAIRVIELLPESDLKALGGKSGDLIESIQSVSL